MTTMTLQIDTKTMNRLTLAERRKVGKHLSAILTICKQRKVRAWMERQLSPKVLTKGVGL